MTDAGKKAEEEGEEYKIKSCNKSKTDSLEYSLGYYPA